MPVLQVYRRMLLGYETVVAERKAREGAGAFGSHLFDVSDLQKILDAAERPGALRRRGPTTGPTDIEVTHGQ